ncbi:translation initiation factor IF-2 [Clostridiaceae bacterium HSG29]|nr:translation initiation factor IF-2 [Clostridiaceae bacterium HSG29]
MSKIRVYQLAKELEMESHDLVEMLIDLGIEVTSHMSSLTEQEAEMILELQEETNEEKVEEEIEEVVEVVDEDALEVKKAMTVGEFASLIGKQPTSLIIDLMNFNIMATINQNIDFDAMKLLADKYKVKIKLEKIEVDELYRDENYEDDAKDLEFRPPIVTVMGHVDHGKTTLLDAMRSTSISDGEAGGITQHIGASEVNFGGKKIVFLDTPGHESFTSLRARGAQVTDIAVLVVAADDSVMPQTVEAIDHAKAAGVPIVVAINKMDVPGANADKVIQELSEHGILVEDWGGDVIAVKVSAKKGEGIDELLEMLLLVAEMEDLKGNPNRLGIGTVIEAELESGRGPIATVIVNNGTMRVGDAITVGKTSGRIRAMYNYKGKKIKKALPSSPIEIAGLSEVPQAGEKIYVTKNDKRARELAEYRKLEMRKEKMRASKHVSLEDLFSQIKEGELKKLNIIIKADAHGSIEALKGSLNKISNAEVKINIIHSNIGTISEADISLAAASNAIIIGFNVRPLANVVSIAKQESVDIRTYRIIYDAINDVTDAMVGMLDPEFVEEILGQIEVRDVFKVSKIGTIAGSYVTSGKITRNSKVRLLRDGIVQYDGEISSLKRFKDDAKEVVSGYECGITLEKYDNIKVGDIIEAYVINEVKRDRV